MKAVMFVLVLTVLDKLTTALVKKNFYINISTTWLKAQEYCRANYSDLSTINSDVEYAIFQIDVDSSHADGWIGLFNNGHGWLWSDRSMLQYQRWTKESANNTNNCAFIKVKDGSGSWDLHSCDKPKTFYCYKWVPGMTLVETKMTWENALVYCRTFYSDLASLNTTRSLLDAKNKTGASVWTGLRFLAGSWFWVTGEPLELQDPLLLCPADPYRCGARTPKTDRWENRDCEEKLTFLCNDNTEWRASSPEKEDVKDTVEDGGEDSGAGGGAGSEGDSGGGDASSGGGDASSGGGSGAGGDASSGRAAGQVEMEMRAERGKVDQVVKQICLPNQSKVIRIKHAN